MNFITQVTGESGLDMGYSVFLFIETNDGHQELARAMSEVKAQGTSSGDDWVEAFDIDLVAAAAEYQLSLRQHGLLDVTVKPAPFVFFEL